MTGFFRFECPREKEKGVKSDYRSILTGLFAWSPFFCGRMWKRRKAEQEKQMLTTGVPSKNWVYHAEWLTLMATVITCFIFVFHESKHTNDRLDDHMEAINRRVDESNTQLNNRCDELHKEFYALLKETRKP